MVHWYTTHQTQTQTQSYTQGYTHNPPVFSYFDCDNFVTTQISKSMKKTKFQIELDKFSGEPIKNVKPVDFWRQNKENYPALFYCFEYI